MEVKIDRLDHFGRGITKVNNKTCFVELALDNEIVNIDIIKEKKKFIEARTSEVIKKSKDRIKSTCPYFPLCGGCNIRHFSKGKQHEFKINKVKDILMKFSNLDVDIGSCFLDNDFYRNKVVFHVKNRKLGFYKEKSHDIIEINECLNVDKKINESIKILKKLVEDKDNNIEEITIKVGNKTDEVLISIKGKVKNRSMLDAFDVVFINGKAITKRDKIVSMIKDKKFLLSDKDFFQVNKYVVEKLYDEVVDSIKEKKAKNVLDLYCGTGTIGIFVADYVDKVLGIEVVPTSIRAAYLNKELNKVDNITFKEGKVEEVLKDVDEEFDTVIFDPPRSGLDKSVFETIEKINPKNIIYVSCDPVTLGRDINVLKEKYNLEKIKVFDMFPNTYHVETICVLKIK